MWRLRSSWKDEDVPLGLSALTNGGTFEKDPVQNFSHEFAFHSRWVWYSEACFGFVWCFSEFIFFNASAWGLPGSVLHIRSHVELCTNGKI